MHSHRMSETFQSITRCLLVGASVLVAALFAGPSFADDDARPVKVMIINMFGGTPFPFSEASAFSPDACKEKASHKIDVVVALAMACFAAVRAQGESSFDQSWQWVDGVPVGGTDAVEQRKAKAKKEADDFYAARLQNYLAQHGAFGFGPPWGRL